MIFTLKNKIFKFMQSFESLPSTVILPEDSNKKNDKIIKKNDTSTLQVDNRWTKEEEDEFILNKVRDGLKYNNIANLLGKKTSTVCSRIKLIASKLLLNKSITEVCEITGLSYNQVLVLQNKLSSKNDCKLGIVPTNTSKLVNSFSTVNYKNKNSQTDTIFNNIKQKFSEIPDSNIFVAENKDKSINILKNISIQLDVLIDLLSKT